MSVVLFGKRGDVRGLRGRGHVRGVTPGVARLWVATLAALAATSGWVAVGAEPVAAHATIVGSDPADGAVLGALPARVVVRVAKKQATAEGDPIQIFDAAGNRLDRGRAEVGDGGGSLSVGVDPARAGSGDYYVLFRIVSADSHVVSGRADFRVAATVPLDDLGHAREVAPSTMSGVVAPRRLLTEPDLVRAGPVALVPMSACVAVLVMVALRWRTSRRRSTTAEPPSHEIAGAASDAGAVSPAPVGARSGRHAVIDLREGRELARRTPLTRAVR